MKTYDELLAERNGLSSQLLSLHRILSDARDCVRACQKQGLADYKLLQTIDHVLQKNSHEQCLAEIKAEAGRAGYVEGADNYFDRHYDKDVSDSVLKAAEEYAAKIRNTGTWLKDSNVNGGKRQGVE